MPTKILQHFLALAQKDISTPRRDFTTFLVRVGAQLPAACILALISLSYALSYSAMIFSSGGNDLLAVGLPLLLITTCVIPVVITLSSSLPFMVGGADSNSSGVLALMVAGIVASMHEMGGSTSQLIATSLCAIALSTVAAGGILMLLGITRRGNLVQFIPFPVIGGFLAGSGYLLVAGAFRIAVGLPLNLTSVWQLSSVHWLVWLPASIVATVMMGASKWGWTHPLVFPLTLLVSGGLFFTGMSFSHISLEQARAMGWLFETLPLHGVHMPFSLTLRDIQWPVLGAHLSEFLAMIVVMTLTILLNATGVGLATRRDVDFNQELRSAGIANLLTGVLGGVVGCQSLSRTMLSYQFGSRDRIATILTALLVLSCAAFFSTIAGFIPKPVLAGLLAGLGGNLLMQWVVKTRRQLALTNYILILLILIVIASVGFVSGVALGIVVACVLFVVDYGRISCIKMEFTGSSLTSRVERSMELSAMLKSTGGRTVGICLHGYLFFGSLNQVLSRIRELLKSPRDFVVIDFQRVQGMDASTSQSFIKLSQMCEQAGARLVMTGISDDARLPEMVKPMVKDFASLDSALEWIENTQIEQLHSKISTTHWHQSLEEYFSEEELARLFKRMETHDLIAGQLLFRKGDEGDCMAFIESGQVSISLALDDGEKIRLRTFGSGTVVGEMALYTGQKRTADVIADAPSRIHKLRISLLRELEHDDPVIALKLHRYVVKLLATRLTATNEAYRLSF